MPTFKPKLCYTCPKSGEFLEIELSQPSSIVGRRPSRDEDAHHVLLADPTVDKAHARIEVHEDGCVIFDLNSRSGTFVNERLISRGDAHPLRAGDNIRVGRVVLNLHDS